MIEFIAVSIAISIVAIVGGFTFCFWLVIKHLKHQELLTKSESVAQYAEQEVMLDPFRRRSLETTAKVEETNTETQEVDITEVTADEAFKPR